MSKKMRAGLELLFLLMILLTVEVFSADWPQLQCNAQRTGYQSENLSLANVEAWNVDWTLKSPPEQLHFQTQVVAAGARAFVGTISGNFYCLDTATGNQNWKYPAGTTNHVGPILHTAGVDVPSGRVFFASMDGCVYCLDVNGNFKWKFDSAVYTPGTFARGFFSAVMLADGKVFAARRDGFLFGINQTDGSQAWQTNIGCPLLQSPAYNNGKVYIGDTDSYVYAINSSNGNQVWKSTDALSGAGFISYFPLVDSARGIVIVKNARGPNILSPDDRYGYVFNENNGLRVSGIPVLCNTGTLSAPPPCMDRDGYYINCHDSYPAHWVRTNPANGQMDEIGVGGDTNETEVFTASGNMIFITCQNGGVGNSNPGNCFNLDTRTWSILPTEQRLGHWLQNGQAGGASGASISNGRVYVTSRGNITYCVR